MKRTIFTAILIFAFCLAAFAQANGNFCPNINISTTNELTRKKELVFFIAEVSTEADKYDVKYNWTVENVKILSGQGTRIIKTLRETDDVGYVSLEVINLPKSCNNTVFKSISAIDPPFPKMIDEFGKISSGETKARTDAFLVELKNDPTAKGFIVISDNKNSVNQLNSLNNYLTLRSRSEKGVNYPT